MKTDVASVIGRLLLAARERQGLTQGQISSMSKVSSRTIVSLEKGRHESEKLRHDVILRLALALGEDPHEWLKEVDMTTTDMEINRCRRILGMTTSMDMIQLSKPQIVASWMELPREDQERVLRMMATFLNMRLVPE